MDERWPIEPGEFIVYDPKKSVCVCTLEDDLDMPTDGLAGSGKLRTENLGVERIVVNTISNPHIRFLVVCGREIKGHRAGQSLIALWRNGLDDKKRIIGAKGAIPYIQNLPPEFVGRFQIQVEVVDLIDEKDPGVFTSMLRDLIQRKPKPFEGPALDFGDYWGGVSKSDVELIELGESEVSVAPEYDLVWDVEKGIVKIK
ncbi:MAG: tetrahydromethanopterin S-methyltransferase subunit A [Candidatus Altiarchaeota archaeon]